MSVFQSKLWASFGLGLALSCSQGPQTDSKSNWYVLCDADLECGDGLFCSCGVCSAYCDAASECGADVSSTCGDPTSVVSCEGGGGQGVCSATCASSQDCPQNTICLENICVADQVPDAAGCSADWPIADRDFELEAMARLNEHRLSDGYCGTMSMQALSSLVFDFRLRCAARNQSLAMFEQGTLEATTPDGVSYSDRINDAGYQARMSIIVYGIGTDLMRIDDIATEYCADVIEPNVTDMAVGKHEQYFTILFGRE